MDAFEASLDPDPDAQFDRWFQEASAAGAPQPEAMAVGTARPDGAPSVRMLLLKGHDARGLAFYTNRESRKAAELAVNPRAALAFHWRVPRERQVRVEGPVEELGPEAAAAYFATRPRFARLAAWASPQSRPVTGREELDRRYEAAAARFGEDEVPLPPFWGGYVVVPDAFEFWQGREHRFHDRVRYERTRDGWDRVRLGP